LPLRSLLIVLKRVGAVAVVCNGRQRIRAGLGPSSGFGRVFCKRSVGVSGASICASVTFTGAVGCSVLEIWVDIDCDRRLSLPADTNKFREPYFTPGLNQAKHPAALRSGVGSNH
jgi:hypothetical protein